MVYSVSYINDYKQYNQRNIETKAILCRCHSCRRCVVCRSAEPNKI